MSKDRGYFYLRLLSLSQYGHNSPRKTNKNIMQTYLVGGAVRDKLLGRTVIERDWVVVGATPQQMLALGYQQVGKDFPVFLHPKTREEYALARTERKSGKGYAGFTTDSSATVTLEEDLIRRDLTVNAIAMDDTGELIDPFNGQQDLHDKVLRHVSDAFVEDPLRVLRVARFAARYRHLGFGIANETLTLMQQLCSSGELEHLSAERVWKETARSLMEQDPQIYFETLKSCGALSYWFAELDVLWGIPNPPKWHPEIDTGVHTMMVLQQTTLLDTTLIVRFAALVHDLGKGLTPAKGWPSHHGHEKLGRSAVDALCDRLKVPNDCRELGLLVSEFHSHIHRAFELLPATILLVFNHCDAWRKPQRFQDLLIACTADARGRTHFENNPYHQADYMWQAYQAAEAVNVQDIISKGHQGPAIREQLERQRQTSIASFKQHWQQHPQAN
jgi:tRNA nucleotidyltransferase (CCA-adding enzyme)